MPEAKTPASGKQSGAKKGNKEGQKFLEALVNAESRNNIWRNVAILIAVLCIFLLYSLIRMSQTVPVRLIPYEVATGMAAIEVGPNGENAKEYLGHIAEADLNLLTNWRFDSVGKRYGALSKRMTPAMLSAQSQQLREEATKYESSRYNQVFFPSRKVAIGNDEIHISGNLTRWAGEINVLETSVAYRLKYVWFNGFPMVDRIERIELTDMGRAR